MVGVFLYKTKQKLTPYSPQQGASTALLFLSHPSRQMASACSDIIPGLRFCQHGWNCAPRLHLFVDVRLHSLGTVPQAGSMDINKYSCHHAHGKCPVPMSLNTSIMPVQAGRCPWCQPNSGKDVGAEIHHPHSLACASPG